MNKFTSYYWLIARRDMGAFLESDNEVIMISTSILSLSRVVESIPFNCLKRPTLFVDVLSVKEHPKDVLLRVCNFHTSVSSKVFHILSNNTHVFELWKIMPEECDLLCTHPMFGPESGKDGWTDLTFMYDMVRIRDQPLCSSFLHIFSSEVRKYCRSYVFLNFIAFS